MGTTWRVLYAGHASAGEVRPGIEAVLAALVDQMSHWAPDSLLCRFNRAAPGEWLPLPPDFAAVIDTALRVAAASEGAFDPAVGTLVDLWGHGPPGPMPRPDDAAIARARTVSGWRRLRWDPPTQRLRQPGGLALDLSGIAKGYAADAVADHLAARGLANALVEVGGELVGRGIRPDGEPWWVDLETPAGCELPPLRIALHELGVATSGSYVRGGHTLDPRNGRPTDNGVVSVSVIAGSAMLADALATALMVGYPETSPGGMRVAARIIVRDGDAFREVLTPALSDMLVE